ncbi:uncharacterized protein LOC123192549 [Mangifera indica]|uniref:uncharacterized protein LOC123192549 n=1 Tax=Mangifera indica TaxID=29780 RepID=UPI001CFAE3A3|nr:uncharacterized protein LOC123192549 [Mangifera indica]
MDSCHTYYRNQILPHHRQASARALGQILRTKFILVDRVYQPKEIIVYIVDRYKIDISYAQAWRARNWALQSLRGTPEESFMLLPEYCLNLERCNPRTVTHILTDEEDRFKYYYMAFGCSIRTFQQHIRSVICIDAVFLKGRYLGQLFIAVALDENNQIYPLAFGIGPREDHDKWCWFLTKLRDCIGEVPHLAIISDQHVSIFSALAEVFPAKAYTEFEFQQVIKLLSRLHPEATAYLCEVGFDRWARVYFPGHRYNVMTTNIAESFNVLVKHARGLPITMLIEFIRDACTSPVTPWVEDKIAKRVRKSSNLEVHPITTERYQVLGNGQYDALVDLTEYTCTCRKFQLSKISCMHVIAVARYMKLTTCLQWVHSYYNTTFYRTVYADAVNPLGDQSEWLHLEEATIIHPLYVHRHRAGRPANKADVLLKERLLNNLSVADVTNLDIQDRTAEALFQYLVLYHQVQEERRKMGNKYTCYLYLLILI